MRKRRALFSICSNNYLPVASVFFESAAKYASEADLFLILVDLKDENCAYPGHTSIIEAKNLDIPDFNCFAFRYDIMELNTAVKPFAIAHLFDAGYDEVLYFDPDIQIFRDLECIVAPMRVGASIVLTPHLLSSSEAGFSPGDEGIMSAGAYNLGFIALRRCPEAIELVRWWSRKLEYDCVNRQDKGVFVDQKYMDLAPSFCQNACILRDPSANVAYWNLGERSLVRDVHSGTFTVDGVPLTFFHYSGFDRRNPRRLSKHTERFTSDLPDALRSIIQGYCDRIDYFQGKQIRQARYTYGYFASGTPIPRIARLFFREHFPEWLGNPFEDFEQFLVERTPSCITLFPAFEISNIIFYIYQTSPWLQASINLGNAEGQRNLCQWYFTHAETIGIDLRLIQRTMARVAPFRREACDARDIDRRASRSSDVCVVGYLTAETGVGEMGRQVLRATLNNDISVTGYDVDLNVHAARLNQEMAPTFSDSVDASVNIYAINSDQIVDVLNYTAPQTVHRGYRICTPFWELARFPEAWRATLAHVDEVWAFSRFVQTAISRAIDKPVLYVPPPLAFTARRQGVRHRLGLLPDRYAFFFAFDCLSYATRKNPIGLIEAFKAAFRDHPQSDRVCLILKIGNVDFASADLLEAIRDVGDAIVIVTERLDREDMLSLLDEIDCVVSLHRSEGLGLLVAEGMALGKPVIATDYSATTDFLAHTTGYPIDYQLIAVQSGEYPFYEGQSWADPDLNQAAWTMRHVVDDADRAKDVGARAQQYINQWFNSERTRQAIVGRLRDLV